ncbi:MAG: hypothetical protein HN867_08460 [Deltaproteobacteria bacterium]|nr:hypothetical protein [Deltaproteobacteria bacterium]
MKNNAEDSIKRWLTSLSIMVVAMILACDAFTMQASTKEISIPPSNDGRSSHAKAASFSFTIPNDYVHLEGISLLARGGSRGNHELLLDSHFISGTGLSEPRISLEQVTFKARRDHQRLTLDLTAASVYRDEWIPGKTKLTLFIQGNKAALKEIYGLEIAYVTSGKGEEVDLSLKEPRTPRPRAQYEQRPTRSSPNPPVDLDDDRSPRKLKPVTSVQEKLPSGRGKDAIPARRVNTSNRRRPSLEDGVFLSDQDEDRDRARTPKIPVFFRNSLSK